MQVNGRSIVTVELHRGMWMLPAEPPPRRHTCPHALTHAGGAAADEGEEKEEEAEEEEEECNICLERMEASETVMLR
jgi:hypothetical protein